MKIYFLYNQLTDIFKDMWVQFKNGKVERLGRVGGGAGRGGGGGGGGQLKNLELIL